jgi:hypothetical protein
VVTIYTTRFNYLLHGAVLEKLTGSQLVKKYPTFYGTRKFITSFTSSLLISLSRQVGSCHHGMARPQVADGGTAFNMEGRCEYIEKAIADSRQSMVLQLGGWARCKQLLTVKTYHVKNNSKRPRSWTVIPPGLTFKKFYILATHCIHVFVRISQQTAIISL